MPEEIVLVSIPKDELQTLIINSVNTCLKHHLPKLEGKEELPELLTIQHVAGYLSVTPQTVHNLVKDGILKKYHIAGSTRFKRKEVREAAAEWEPYQRN